MIFTKTVSPSNSVSYREWLKYLAIQIHKQKNYGSTHVSSNRFVNRFVDYRVLVYSRRNNISTIQAKGLCGLG